MVLIVDSISNQKLNKKSGDINYLVTGMINVTKLSIMRAYYKDRNLIIENNIDTSDDGRIQNKKIL